MTAGAFLRYFCPMDSIGLSYHEAFKAAGWPVRVLPTCMMEMSMSAAWAAHGDDLVRPVPSDHYLNVVAGTNGELVRLFTVGVPNIAIAYSTSSPSAHEVGALRDYQLVICPTEEGVAMFAERGIIGRFVEPKASLIAPLLRAML